jgi:phosphatidylserine/phosphatidylglycerophosphate/cardiolipin synthase-like enzyme
MLRYTRSQAILRSGAAYGAGFAGGTALIIFLLHNRVVDALVDLLDPLQLFLRLLFAILFISFTVGLGGGVAGTIGGRTLDKFIEGVERKRIMWRSALSFFLASSLLLIPFYLATAVVAFFNPDIDVDINILLTLFTVYGLVYGLLAGLLLGWLTVGLRNTLGVLLSSAGGFALGGFLAGLVLFLLSQQEFPSTLTTNLFVILGLLLFGICGGAALGFAYQHIGEDRPLFPDSRPWRILRYAVLTVLAVIFLGAAAKLINTLTIRPAEVAETLTLPTRGTHWTILDNGDAVFQADSTAMQSLTCSADGRIGGSQPALESLPDNLPRCTTDPVLIDDVNGDLHLVWYSQEALKNTGENSRGHFLYESILASDEGWSMPAIIARTNGETEPTLANDGQESLVLTWRDTDGEHVATYVEYDCADASLNRIGQAVFAAVRQEKFRPAEDIIPYCRNQYDQLLLTPNPTAPESTLPRSEYGAFDQIVELVIGAEYEVLFATMQWDKPSNQGSPGATLGAAVADLYRKVKANPDAFPRGMTVRILLGNIPDLAIMEPTTQIYHALQDLRDAGVAEMENEEIGWKLEVADFSGSWPHAHSKFAIIDGKTTLAAGFNYSYLHLSSDHPSGQGLDMTDKGIQFTGPVAQASMSAYDDLWTGSSQVSCTNFPPPIPLLDFLWCDVDKAEATHPPEVLRFYPADGAANAFSLHHTLLFQEADEAIIAAILHAEDTLDLYEVNFSLHSICLLAVFLTDICDVDDVVTPYMQALLTAVIENDVKVRAVVEKSAMNGFENRIAIEWLEERLAEAGKSDNVEIRFGSGKIHDKAILVDNAFLIVGSQNFHWSAWDTPSLTEYSLATDDETAIADFHQEFEHQWELAIPVEIENLAP